MKNKKNRKKIYFILFLILLILFLLLVVVSVSYAVVYTTLNINGSSAVFAPNWNIEIDNIQYKKSGAFIDRVPFVSGTMIKDYRVAFTYPGDKITMTFDVSNKGNINSKLEYFDFGKLRCTYKSNGRDASDYCKNISYDVFYNDGTSIRLGDELLSGENKKVSVVLTYNKNSPRIMNDSILINGLNLTLIYGQL